MKNNYSIDISLINTIYDATLNENRWQDVVDALSADAPGTATLIRRHDFGTEDEETVIQSGIDPRWMVDYLAHYKKINPFIKILKTQKVNSYKDDDILFRMKEISHSEYYKFFLKPQNFETGIHIKLDSDKKKLIWFSKLIRDDEDGEITAHSLAQIRACLPHISRAIRISRHISTSKIDILNLEDTIDKLSVATFVISGMQAVTYANVAARKLLNTSAALKVNRSNHVHAQYHNSDEQLQSAIRFSLTHSHCPPPIKIQRSDNKRPLIAIVLRYHHENQWQSKFDRLFSDKSEGICLFVFDPAIHMAPLNGVIASAFNLTPAQTRLTRALAEGSLLQDYADQAGISRNTARNHLAAIMEKMGITRQSELISMISQFSSISCSPK